MLHVTNMQWYKSASVFCVALANKQQKKATMVCFFDQIITLINGQNWRRNSNDYIYYDKNISMKLGM